MSAPPSLHPRPPKSTSKQHQKPTYFEFLPAALEVIEKPASPIRMALIWFICLVAAFCLIWSYYGSIDVVSTAQGKVQPAGRVRVVQSLESGRVRSFTVKNGSAVHMGDPLVELDDTEVKTEEAQATGNLLALRAELSRRSAELAAVEVLAHEPQRVNPDIDRRPQFEADIPSSITAREERIFRADLLQLQANLANLSAQLALHKKSEDRLEKMIAAQQNLITTLSDRVSMRSGLVTKEAGSKSELMDATQVLLQEEATLSELLGQLVEAQASQTVSITEREKALKTFIAENEQRSGEIARQVDDLEQQRIKAANRRASMIITAPIDGVVQASSITTFGQVVSSGNEIMRIVPKNIPLEIEAYLSNQDVGFVREGQPVIIKVETFPFTRYGILHGTVSSVANDAVPNPDAQQMEQEAAPQLKSLSLSGNVQRLQNLVYPVTVSLESEILNVGNMSMPIAPGMAVSIEIQTDRRRIIDYFWSPIVKVASEAFVER